MKALLIGLWKDEAGATTIEYGLIVSLVSISIIVTLGVLGTSVADLFSAVADTLSNHAQV